MNFVITTTRQYRKAFSKFAHSGRFKDLEKVKACLVFLENDIPLPPRYRSHRLLGEYADIFECHIAFDVLLMYKIDREIGLVTLVNLGSHPELFD